MTAATISNWQFLVGTAASPQVLTSLEEVIDASGIGVANELVPATNWDSPTGTKEFIAGLAEGEEFTVECNYVTNATMQEAMMTAVDSGDTRLARLVYTAVSPQKTWDFSAVCLNYVVNPENEAVNTITFTFKITGAVTRA